MAHSCIHTNIDTLMRTVRTPIDTHMYTQVDTHSMLTHAHPTADTEPHKYTVLQIPIADTHMDTPGTHVYTNTQD